MKEVLNCHSTNEIIPQLSTEYFYFRKNADLVHIRKQEIGFDNGVIHKPTRSNGSKKENIFSANLWCWHLKEDGKDQRRFKCYFYMAFSITEP